MRSVRLCTEMARAKPALDTPLFSSSNCKTLNLLFTGIQRSLLCVASWRTKLVGSWPHQRQVLTCDKLCPDYRSRPVQGLCIGEGTGAGG